jgi:hypothetical protein
MKTLATHRYLVLAEAHFGPQTSKTANSAVRYLPDRVLAVIDSLNAQRTVGDVLGFGGEIPIISTLEEGLPWSRPPCWWGSRRPVGSCRRAGVPCSRRRSMPASTW